MLKESLTDDEFLQLAKELFPDKDFTEENALRGAKGLIEPIYFACVKLNQRDAKDNSSSYLFTREDIVKMVFNVYYWKKEKKSEKDLSNLMLEPLKGKINNKDRKDFKEYVFKDFQII